MFFLSYSRSNSKTAVKLATDLENAEVFGTWTIQLPATLTAIAFQEIRVTKE